MTGCPDQRGFTLIETLIAMVILAMVMVLLAGGLRAVTASWDRGTRAADAGEAIALAHDTLRRDAAAAPRLTWPAATKPATTFRGDPDRVGLVVVDPGFPGKPGLAVAIFHVETEDGVTALRYGRAAYDPKLADFAAVTLTDDMVLARGRTALAFDYYGIVPGQAEPRWVSPWPDPQSRPRLVRLRSRDPATGAAPWPDLIVPLPVDAEAACIRARMPKDEEGQDQAQGQQDQQGRQQPPQQPPNRPPPAAADASADPGAGDTGLCTLPGAKQAGAPGSQPGDTSQQPADGSQRRPRSRS